MTSQNIIKLTAPLLDSDNIKEKISCIRPHRERIFNIATQQKDNKLICHNYGHGGAGWTFLFGSVHKSIEQFEQALAQYPEYKNKPVAIIGAGAYGLLTAVMLAHKKYQVTIIAKESENISSHKAAGFFFPRHRKCSTPEEIAQFASIGLESYRTYLQIFDKQHPFITHGVKLLPAYYGLDIDPGFGPYIQDNLIEKPRVVTIDFGNNKTYNVAEYRTIHINSCEIMQQLRTQIDSLGIKIVQDTISNFNQINQQIIFNCAGLGAKELASDAKILPVQGHLISLKEQPDVTKLQYMLNVKVTMTNPNGTKRDELIYFAPKDQGILGITFIRNQQSLSANPHEFERLLKRSKDFFGT